MPTVKEAKIPELNCPQQEQTCSLITLLTSGVTVSVSIYTAVELDDLTPNSEFEQNHGMNPVHLSIDSGCWPLEDIVIQAKLGMSALVDAANNILLRLNNLGKQYETRCVLHTGLLLEELCSKVVPLYMLTNHCILQPGNSVILQMVACHLNDQKSKKCWTF